MATSKGAVMAASAAIIGLASAGAMQAGAVAADGYDVYPVMMSIQKPVEVSIYCPANTVLPIDEEFTITVNNAPTTVVTTMTKNYVTSTMQSVPAGSDCGCADTFPAPTGGMMVPNGLCIADYGANLTLGPEGDRHVPLTITIPPNAAPTLNGKYQAAQGAEGGQYNGPCNTITQTGGAPGSAPTTYRLAPFPGESSGWEIVCLPGNPQPKGDCDCITMTKVVTDAPSPISVTVPPTSPGGKSSVIVISPGPNGAVPTSGYITIDKPLTSGMTEPLTTTVKQPSGTKPGVVVVYTSTTPGAGTGTGTGTDANTIGAPVSPTITVAQTTAPGVIVTTTVAEVISGETSSIVVVEPPTSLPTDDTEPTSVDTPVSTPTSVPIISVSIGDPVVVTTVTPTGVITNTADPTIDNPVPTGSVTVDICVDTRVPCPPSLPGSCVDLQTDDGVELAISAPTCVSDLAGALQDPYLTQADACLSAITSTTKGSDVVTCLTNILLQCQTAQAPLCADVDGGIDGGGVSGGAGAGNTGGNDGGEGGGNDNNDGGNAPAGVPPLPLLTCDNIGLRFAIIPNPFYNADAPTYSAFDTTYFHTASPACTGQAQALGIPVIGFTPDQVYPGCNDYNLEYKAIIEIGYLYAPVDGVYTFTIPFSDDITYMWIGSAAVSADWNAGNARLVNGVFSGQSVSAQVQLSAGTYVPFRTLWGNGQGGYSFPASITDPTGALIISEAGIAQPLIVSQTCGDDRLNFPDFPPLLDDEGGIEGGAGAVLEVSK